MLDRVIDHPVEQIDVPAWIGGKCSSEMQVMIGISKPLKRGEQHAFNRQKTACAPDNLGEEHAVGCDWQMKSMLLDRRDRKHNRGMRRECSNLLPGEVGEIHGSNEKRKPVLVEIKNGVD